MESERCAKGPLLKVPPLGIIKSLGTKLTRKPLKKHSEKYVTQMIVRPLLKQILERVEVSCWAKWNKEKKQLEGKLKHNRKCYQWIIKDASI